MQRVAEMFSHIAHVAKQRADLNDPFPDVALPVRMRIYTPNLIIAAGSLKPDHRVAIYASKELSKWRVQVAINTP